MGHRGELMAIDLRNAGVKANYKKILNKIDIDGNGNISYTEFMLAACEHKVVCSN